jgi:hypothetical protein
MRDTASETLALPFEESASSFSYPITNNSFPPCPFISGFIIFFKRTFEDKGPCLREAASSYSSVSDFMLRI